MLMTDINGWILAFSIRPGLQLRRLRASFLRRPLRLLGITAGCHMLSPVRLSVVCRL